MKKRFYFSLLLLIILIPCNIKGIKIDNIEITGDSIKKVGEEVKLTFKINFTDMITDNNHTEGIWFIGFRLDYDEDVLVASNITSPHFNSIISNEDNEHYVVSEVIEDSNNNNYCNYGTLYCNNYTVTIIFYIKNNNVNNTMIGMDEVEVILLDMVDDNKEYTLEDATYIDSSISKKHNISIQTNTDSIDTQPKDITGSNIKKDTKKTINNDNIDKSNNSLLKTLSVTNYNIDFNKTVNDYTIYVDNGINTLDVIAETDDSNAIYTIIGADDLKANDNKVLIEVTAHDGTKNIYTINVKSKEENSIYLKRKNRERKKPATSKKINSKTLIWIGISIIGMILITIIIYFIIKKKDKKIDQFLDNV